jgi:hypothetical protein
MSRMTKDEDLNTESFVKKLQSTTMDGMMTSIMATLLLMMLLPCSRVAGYPMATIIQAATSPYV